MHTIASPQISFRCFQWKPPAPLLPQLLLLPAPSFFHNLPACRTKSTDMNLDPTANVT